MIVIAKRFYNNEYLYYKEFIIQCYSDLSAMLFLDIVSIFQKHRMPSSPAPLSERSQWGEKVIYNSLESWIVLVEWEKSLCWMAPVVINHIMSLCEPVEPEHPRGE